jgi:hypothetical protein
MKYRHTADRRMPWVMAACCACLGMVLAWHFARHQSLWFDEVSQMKGTTLAPLEAVRWLCGVDAQRFAVPPDRNPPLSYWSGYLWTKMWGHSETALRWQGVVFLGLSTVFLARAGWRIGGGAGLLLAALLFTLSPNVIENCVEIRSYGLWTLLASAAWWQFTEIVISDQSCPRRFSVLLGLCLLASFTHFFGVVQSACMLSVAGIVLLRHDTRWWKLILMSAAAYGVCSLALVPFVRWAIEHVDGAEAEMDPLTTGFGYGLQRMVYRLVGHPASAVHRVWLLLLLGGYVIASLLLLLKLCGRRTPATVPPESFTPSTTDERTSNFSPSLRAATALAIAIMLGLACNIAGRMIVTSFDPLRSRYSLWMLPGVVLFAVAALQSWSASGAWGWLRPLSYACLCSGAVGTAWIFAAHPLVFSHGPQRVLEAMIDSSTQQPIVIYEPSRVWGFGYVPMLYRYDHQLLQLRCRTPEAEDAQEPRSAGAPVPWVEHELVWLDGPALTTDLDAVPAGTRVLVVSLDALGQRDLRRHLTFQPFHPEQGPVLQQLLSSGKWTIVKQEIFVSYTACYAVLLERGTDPSRLSDSQPDSPTAYQSDNPQSYSAPRYRGDAPVVRRTTCERAVQGIGTEFAKGDKLFHQPAP